MESAHYGRHNDYIIQDWRVNQQSGDGSANNDSNGAIIRHTTVITIGSSAAKHQPSSSSELATKYSAIQVVDGSSGIDCFERHVWPVDVISVKPQEQSTEWNDIGRHFDRSNHFVTRNHRQMNDDQIESPSETESKEKRNGIDRMTGRRNSSTAMDVDRATQIVRQFFDHRHDTEEKRLLVATRSLSMDVGDKAGVPSLPSHRQDSPKSLDQRLINRGRSPLTKSKIPLPIKKSTSIDDQMKSDSSAVNRMDSKVMRSNVSAKSAAPLAAKRLNGRTRSADGFFRSNIPTSSATCLLSTSRNEKYLYC